MGIPEVEKELENTVNEYNFCIKKSQELLPEIHKLTGKLEAYKEIEAEKKKKPTKPIDKKSNKEKPV